MAFDFLSSLNTTTLFLLIIIFILFVLSMKKVFSMIINAVWISVAAILFPIIMNRFFGFDIPIDRDSLISFILLGLAIYFIYLIGKSIYGMIKVTGGAAKKVMPKMEKREKKERKEDKYEGEDLKEREKDLKKREKELKKQEREMRWKAALEANKAKGKTHGDKDYVVIKDSEKLASRKSHVEPLPVIEHKKKKKK